MSELTFWASVAKLILALPVVVLLAYLSLRMTASVSARAAVGANLEVLEKKALSKNQFLYIVKAGASYHLMAGTDHNMTLIRDMSPEEIKARDTIPGDADRFREVLTNALSKVRRSA